MLRDLGAALGRSARRGRLPRIVALVAAATIGAALLALSVEAQTGGDATAPAAPEAAPEQPPNPQPWTITCGGQGASGDLVCAMTQGLIAKNTGQRVLTVSISKLADGGYGATLSLPHGLLLPEGVQTWIDEGPRLKHTITTADQNGSYASLTLDGATVEALKKGTILNVLVKSSAGDEVIFQLSLNGFSAALAKL